LVVSIMYTCSYLANSAPSSGADAQKYLVEL
jgi:hypothetical protein